MALPADVAQEVAIRADGAPARLFNESLDVHEDVELCAQVKASGRRIGYAPDAPVLHRRDTTFGSLLGRNYEMARASRRLGAQRAAQRAASGSLLAGRRWPRRRRSGRRPGGRWPGLRGRLHSADPGVRDGCGGVDTAARRQRSG